MTASRINFKAELKAKLWTLSFILTYDMVERNLSTEKLMLFNWVLEKTLESPLDCKEIQSVNPKGSQSWIFIGRTDVEAEALILWPPDAKSWLIGKDPDAGKDWRWEEKGMTDDEMVGWHHQLDGWVWESSGSWWWTESLACYSPWGRKESDMTEQLKWTELMPWSKVLFQEF